MVMTTWDGHLRIDHVAAADVVTLTLLTLEATTEIQPRTGLTTGFVTADPHGPPAYIAVGTAGGRLPPDVAALLGPEVARAVQGADRWLRLDLVQVDELAAAWAPYREVALASVQRGTTDQGALGTWADELWTCLGLPNWPELLRPVPKDLAFRGPDTSADQNELRGTWQLPQDLAEAVGVAPAVTWRLVQVDTDAFEIDLTVRPTGRPAVAVLEAGLDDGSQSWRPFDAGRLRLSGSGRPSVRFRSQSRSSR